MAARLPVRFLARHARTQYMRRPFSTSHSQYEAQNFMMPAMSPTMTEGNISSWKFKEGDSFSTGDVLLEIETDKASMDVEAQEDGIIAKIFQGDGSKAVKVGTRIAVLAEAGDDISSLSIPADNSAPVSSPAENVNKPADSKNEVETAPKGTPENKRPARDHPKTSPQGPGQNPRYPLYPAVQALILKHHIAEADVFKIPASGPGGRLLKGDVLAHLDKLSSPDYAQEQSARIKHLGHLDLSNIKPASTPRAPGTSGATTEAIVGKDAEAASVPATTSIAVSVSLAEVLKVQQRLQQTLGTTIPLSAFLARAVDEANDDLPLPKNFKPSSSDLFNAVLGVGTTPRSSRGSYLPHIDAFPSPSSFSSSPRASRGSSKPVDIIDILSGKAKPVRSVAGRAARSSAASTVNLDNSSAGGALNMFSLTVPVGEEKRARVFLERMKTVLQVEPGRLVL